MAPLAEEGRCFTETTGTESALHRGPNRTEPPLGGPKWEAKTREPTGYKKMTSDKWHAGGEAPGSGVLSHHRSCVQEAERDRHPVLPAVTPAPGPRRRGHNAEPDPGTPGTPSTVTDGGRRGSAGARRLCPLEPTVPP